MLQIKSASKDGSLDIASLIQPEWYAETALVSVEKVLTCLELQQAVLCRAGNLRKSIRSGETATLEMPRSAEYVINLLAVLGAGAVVAPIEPLLPELRRQMILRMLKPALRIQVDGDVKGSEVPDVLHTKREGDAPAYIFFTSGSSGTPKAILGSLKSLRRFIDWQGREFKIGPGDRISFLTAVGFDVSLRDILLPLLHGATLVIPNAEAVTSPQATINWLCVSGITHVHGVPSIARLWARGGGSRAVNLKALFLAGEKLTSTLVEELRQAFPNIEQIVNLYGPTETTLAKFYHRIDFNDFSPDPDAPDIPVGAPLPGTRFYLLEDEAQRTSWTKEPAETNASGEVVIVTADASLGYIGGPGNTADRFHDRHDGTVAYRTGDLGRLSKKGDLIIIGRADDEIKINGVRIHPLEVEQSIAGAPMVRDVAVVTQKTTGDDARLLAFWTALTPSDSALSDTAPRAFALSVLPRAMVPTMWTRLESWPLNSNGKLDRKALLQLMQPSKAENLGSLDAESTWVLEAVADILNLPTSNIADDFFSLGGTSLHVAFLIGRIEKDLNKIVNFAEVFEKADLENIAQLIHNAPEKEKVAIKPVTKTYVYEISPQQRRWWNIYLPERNRSWATMVKPINLRGTFAKAAIQQALFDTIIAQDSMQLFFTLMEGRLRQRRYACERPDDIKVVEHDLAAEESDIAAQKLNEIRLSIANHEIDPFTWPLFWIHAVALPQAQTCLLFAIHHMISDGYSLGLIETALRDALEKGLGYAPKIQFNYLSYANWALDQEERSFGPGSPAFDYWRHLFREPYAKVLLPEQWKGVDHDRGKGYCCKVPDKTRRAVEEIARREKLTVFSIYLASKFLTWHSLLNCDDIVIGTPAAGRDVPGTEQLMGNFISLVCIRSRNPDRSDLTKYVRQTMQSVARAMTFQGYQYDKLVSSLGLGFEQDRFPLTTIFISYLNFDANRAAALSQAELGHTDLGSAVKFDLMAYVREHKDATSLQVQYRNNLFRPEEVTAFVDLWLEILEKMTRTKLELRS